MATQEYYVTPETGLNVVGIATTTALPLPANASIIQEFTPRDALGNQQLFNADGSVKQLASGGAFTAMPTPTAVGSVLVNGPLGVEITCPPGTFVTYTVAAGQPTSAPTILRTFGTPNGSQSYTADRVLCAVGVSVYVTVVSGLGALTPFYRSI